MGRKLELGCRIQSQAASLSSCLPCNWHPINATTDSSHLSDFSVGLCKHQREGKNQLVHPAWLSWLLAHCCQWQALLCPSGSEGSHQVRQQPQLQV